MTVSEHGKGGGSLDANRTFISDELFPVQRPGEDVPLVEAPVANEEGWARPDLKASLTVIEEELDADLWRLAAEVDLRPGLTREDRERVFYGLKESILEEYQKNQDARFKLFEEKCTDEFGLASTIPFELGRSLLEEQRAFFREGSTPVGGDFVEYVEVPSKDFLDRVTESSSLEELQAAHQEIFNAIHRLLSRAEEKYEGHLWADVIDPLVLDEILVDANRVVEVSRDAELKQKMEETISALREILLDVGAGLAFDQKYHQNAVHILGHFSGRITNIKEALVRIADFEAKRLFERVAI